METFKNREWLSNVEKIEKNKNKLDLKPNIDFVSRNKEKFETGLKDILDRTPTQEAQKWIEEIEFIGTDDIVEPQVSPDVVKKILSRMPESLIKLSKLKNISYHTYGNPRVIPVPGFDEKGNFDPNQVELVVVDDFPRKEDHPSRILVGVSNGETIFPTPIPKSVSKDERAVFLYQVHVLLHEFFHTIDSSRRDSKLRDGILFELDDKRFTFQDWWMDFEKLVLSGKEPVCVSYYANTYANDLNLKTAKKDYMKFTYALVEQICESFVAYQLGIISNDDGWTDFRNESFGNKAQNNNYKYIKAKSANLKWSLIDQICRAKVIQQENIE